MTCSVLRVVTLVLSNLVFTAMAFAGEDSLLIRDVTVVSPERTEPLGGADVYIRNGLISRVSGKRIEVSDVPVLDGSGLYLTPGLIDSHVHLGSDAGMRPDQARKRPELLEAFRRQEPRSYLYHGFTTVVDLKQSDAFARRWRRNANAPELIYCQALPFPNGYSVAFLPEATRHDSPYLLDDSAQRDAMPEAYLPSEHTPEAVIEKVTDTGASCIKTFYEAGFAGLWDWPTPPDGLVKAVNAHAAKRGLLHFHHANSLDGYRQAAIAGVDVMAHGLWHWGEFNGASSLPGEVRAVLDRLIDNGAAFQPTSQVLESELRLFSPAFLNNQALARVVPAGLLDWYRTGEGQWFRARFEKNLENRDAVSEFLGGEPSGDPRETSWTALRRLEQVVAYLHERGARIVLASDTPSSPTYTNPPGLNGYLELRALGRMGMTPREALAAATIENARTLGVADRLGTVEAGKAANLLLLASDPLDSLQAFDRISHIVIHGRPIERRDLEAL